MKPYYADDLVTLYHGDWQDVEAALCDASPSTITAGVVLTDPPYGIAYKSNHAGVLPREIAGDDDTLARDTFLECLCAGTPALVFGSWRAPRPASTRMVLVWDTGGALGMGALDLPWKPAHQEIYVLGSGFLGPRTSDVLRYPPVQSMASNGRTHPHEKPVDLLQHLLTKCPDGVVADPFCGTGSTLVAAKNLGRHAIGIEIEERYCEVAAKRLSQGVLALENA